jgi:putative ATP-dependent endonuclease of OLD family
MQIHAVSISNFRGIRQSTLRLDEHTLVLGSNNACKSTVLEALNLALGPDRVSHPDSINEHDFHNGLYYVAPGDGDGDGDHQTAHPEIRIEVVLGDLTSDERSRFRDHYEPWHRESNTAYTVDEQQAAQPPEEDLVVRVGLRGFYDVEEDSFGTESYFLHPPPLDGQHHDSFKKRDKQAVGFLYLRGLRTARRAATLQRGSLLDILLGLHGARPRVWESLLQKLKHVGSSLDEDEQFRSVLNGIEDGIRHYIPLAGETAASGLHVSRLTRENLRTVVSYFLASQESSHSVPHDGLGGGTTNILVLALLSAIADVKDNVIFALEEPEIALAPHTQRRVIRHVQSLAQQTITTSHSPYVAELFLPNGIVVLQRGDDGAVKGHRTNKGGLIKNKILRQEFRTRYAEGLLSNTVLVLEGETELQAIPAVSEMLAGTPGTAYQTLDFLGIVPVNAKGSGHIASSADFFRDVGIDALGVADQFNDANQRAATEAACTKLWEIPHKGFERLLTDELSLDWVKFCLVTASEWPDFPLQVELPGDDASEEEWRKALAHVLKMRKGASYAARVLQLFDGRPYGLPPSILKVLAEVHCFVTRELIPGDDPLADHFRAAAPGSVATPEEAPVDPVPPASNS